MVTKLSSAMTAFAGQLAPIGTLLPYAGSSAPTGWAMCDGNAVSRTTYSTLYTALGTTWGTGDGSTTFNLPDLRGRMLAGKDDMGAFGAASRLTSGSHGLDGATLGADGGDVVASGSDSQGAVVNWIIRVGSDD
ncbi:MAG: phage tail protein [Planctomycetota bacterium]|jgi:microcystin-dependent protein|nr:phage tail protein [Planctomycetota bacterium]